VRDSLRLQQPFARFGVSDAALSLAVSELECVMTKVSILVGSCILIGLSPVSAASIGEKLGVNSTLGISPKTADFVSEAAISDMFEIQSSQLAVARGDDATKSFAQQMIADHQKTTADLKELVASKKVDAPLPTEMDSAHKGMLDKLNGLNGADFTKQYHADQVSAHKDAVSLFQRYAKGGRNAPLKSWAATTEPNLEHHLEMAKALDK
jgi:putative membrane protein